MYGWKNVSSLVINEGKDCQLREQQLPVSYFFPGTRPKVLDANFDDLLSGQGFAGGKDKKGPKTIAEMRKEEMAKEMDPEKLKVENKK